MRELHLVQTPLTVRLKMEAWGPAVSDGARTPSKLAGSFSLGRGFARSWRCLQPVKGRLARVVGKSGWQEAQRAGIVTVT